MKHAHKTYRTAARILIVFGVLLCNAFYGTRSRAAQDPKVEKPDSVKGRDILNKAVAAAGGQVNFDKIRNFTIKTQSTVQAQTTLELTVTETIQPPDKTLQVMELAAGTRSQGVDGDRGWKKLGKTVSDLTGVEKREVTRGLFRDTISLFKASENPDLRVEYLGQETVGGKTSLILRIRNALGDHVNLYINAATFLVEKKTYQGAAEVGLATLEEIYSDYRAVDGIRIPFRIVVRANGRKFIESKVLEVAFNKDLPDSFFRPN